MDQSPDSPIDWSAGHIAQRIAAREISSVEVVQAHIARIEAVDGKLNAVVVRRFEEALREAAAVDATPVRTASEGSPPLLGVPMTVKECFHLAGTPSCIGLDADVRRQAHSHDGLLVQRLKRAGAIILGKTNIPQLMIWHECDNPAYGRTNNPWSLDRTPGGSTGGEAAIIAARGSPLGLGNDLGGSIRVPAHFCGIHGLKPTTNRLPRVGATSTLRGFESILTQPGPLARHTGDLWLALQILADDSDGFVATDVAAAQLRDPAAVAIDQLKIAVWTDDGVFPSSPAVQRAVREAADALAQRGAAIVEIEPADLCASTDAPLPGDAPGANGQWNLDDMFDFYCGLVGADGGAAARRLTAGSSVDWRLGRLMWLAGLDSITRLMIATGLQAFGQQWMARLVSIARPLSADQFWQLTNERKHFVQSFTSNFRGQGFDAVLCPPHALPAMQHVKGFDLIAAASYSFLFNLLGWPAGTVSLTRVRAGEEESRPASRDQVSRQAQAVDRKSAGLPVGVQVAALPWREDLVLAVMSALEAAFRSNADYPGNARVPAIEADASTT